MNDGSSRETEPIFTTLATMDRIHVLTHDKNKGKGRALKTAFSYCLDYFPHLDGVITADSDGQHAVTDVDRVAKQFTKTPHSFVLGVRNFNENQVPKKSLIGNVTTSALFYLLFRQYLQDTQTGLRAIPMKELTSLIHLKGERYEYEINMLIYAMKRNIPIEEVPIQTIYLDNNSGSYYRPIKDSVKIFNRLMASYFLFNRQLIQPLDESNNKAGGMNE